MKITKKTKHFKWQLVFQMRFDDETSSVQQCISLFMLVHVEPVERYIEFITEQMWQWHMPPTQPNSTGI